MSLNSKDFYVFGNYRLDAEGGVLFEGDRVVAMPPKQIATLIVLVRAQGAVVDRETLVRQVWPDTFVEEAGLTRNVSQLRKAIEVGGIPFIETIPKRGYRFVAPVRIERTVPDTVHLVERITSIRVEEETDDELPSPVRALEGSAAQRRSWRWVVPIAVAVAATMAAIAPLWRLADPSARSPQQIRTLAIIPFRDLTQDPADRFLSVGLADTLIGRFANLSSITVAPTATVLAMGNRHPIDTGKALGVEAVIDGSIQRSAQHVRITAQLLEVATGRLLWAGTFDETAEDLMSVEDGVAGAIASLLVPNLGGEERRRLAQRGTANPVAWRDYLHGRALWATRGPRQLEEAVTAFESAIKSDPSYALAYTGLAQALAAQSAYQYRWAREVQPRAKTAALRALELDPLLGDAHGVLGGIAFTFDWDWATAERELTRGLSLNPNESALYQLMSNLLMARGRFNESVIAAETAVRLDPHGFAPNSNFTLMLGWARRYEESVAQGLRTMQVPGIPAYPAAMNATNYLLLGRRAEAQSAFEDARQMIGNIPIVIATEARLAAVDGQMDRARNLIAQLEVNWEQKVVEPIFIAAPYVNVGDHDRALQWLRRAADARTAYTPYMAIDPSFDRLHGDPRFRELLRVVGIEDVLKGTEVAR